MYEFMTTEVGSRSYAESFPESGQPDIFLQLLALKLDQGGLQAALLLRSQVEILGSYYQPAAFSG